MTTFLYSRSMPAAFKYQISNIVKMTLINLDALELPIYLA